MSNEDKFCVGCNKLVLDVTPCPICSAPYHQSCAKRTAKLDNGGYTKCCKTTLSQQFISNTPNMATTSVIASSDIDKIIKNVATDFESRLTKVVDKISANSKSAIADLKSQFTKVISTVNSSSDKFDTMAKKFYNVMDRLD